MELKRIDVDLLCLISNEWGLQLNTHDAVHPARCLGAIARAKENIQGATVSVGDQYAYAIMQDDETHGIVLLSHACPRSPSSWLKVLEVTLCPLYAINDSKYGVDVLIEIAVCVLTDVYELASDIHLSTSVKVYGDSLMDARIWRSAASRIEHGSLPFEVSSHGQWLELKNIERA